MDKEKNPIGKYIKETRECAGMTQAQLAQALGVTPQAISQYERGIKRPKVETLKRISIALGVDDPQAFVTTCYNLDLASLMERLADRVRKKNNRLQDLEAAFNNLNETGQQIAVQRVEELGKIPEYRADQTTSAAPAPEDPDSE